MPQFLNQHDLIAELQKQTAALGLAVQGDAQQGLTGEAEKIGAKWWLGGRKVAYFDTITIRIVKEASARVASIRAGSNSSSSDAMMAGMLSPP